MNPFLLTKYYSKKSFLAVFGGELRIFDENQNAILFFVKQKVFKLKEDISIFSDESKTKELLNYLDQNSFKVSQETKDHCASFIAAARKSAEGQERVSSFFNRNNSNKND